MNRHRTVVLALAFSAVSGSLVPQAFAQRIAGQGYQTSGWVRPAGAQVAFAQQQQMEELPPQGMAADEGPFRDDPVGNSDVVGGQHYPGAFSSDACCQDGPYGTSNECSPGCDSRSSCLTGGQGSQFFFQADYLYARANFSEATALVTVVEDQATATSETTFHQFDFERESSYRFGGGYRLCGCGDEIRFMYTRLSGDASEVAVPGDIVPYETSPPPGGTTDINADVDLKTFDLEFAKRIPLGGGACCECGDACGGQCGCGESCGQCCPAWDLAWSGGIRIADAGWSRSYQANLPNNTVIALPAADIEMDFEGVGLRVGLEGRRYFFESGWLSAFMKGDISLLLGDVEIESVRTTDNPNTPASPDTTDIQTLETREVIPVTEIEAGLTAQVTCQTAFSAGYMFSAWHDLGFRDEADLEAGINGAGGFTPIVSYDDANILSFDGFFARFEWAY